MNILRVVNMQDSEGTVIDLEYEFAANNTIQAADIRVYSILENKVGKIMDNINIVSKILIAGELIKLLETSNE